MKISKRVYDEIMRLTCQESRECGGILGRSGDVVTCHYFDKGIRSDKVSYSPDTMQINKVLEQWYDHSGIELAGLFHSHLYSVERHSNEDCKYIKHILLSLAPKIKYIYVPIINVPEQTMIGFKAYNLGHFLLIEQDEIIIV